MPSKTVAAPLADLEVTRSHSRPRVSNDNGIGLHTPADVHFGLATANAADRREVLDAARAQHPHRLATTTPPKILALPDTVWINRPADDTAQETDTTAA
jgi:putative transposase